MWGQSNNSQIREKEKSPEKDLEEIGESKLSGIDFRVMIIKMLKGDPRWLLMGQQATK